MLWPTELNLCRAFASQLCRYSSTMLLIRQSCDALKMFWKGQFKVSLNHFFFSDTFLGLHSFLLSHDDPSLVLDKDSGKFFFPLGLSYPPGLCLFGIKGWTKQHPDLAFKAVTPLIYWLPSKPKRRGDNPILFICLCIFIAVKGCKQYRYCMSSWWYLSLCMTQP